MAKEYKNHSEVKSQHKWNLDFLLENKTPQERLEELVGLVRELIAVKDLKYSSSNDYLSYLKKNEIVKVKMNKFRNYVSNSMSLNVVDPVISSLYQQFSFVFYQLNMELGAENARFFENADKLAKWKELPEFANYKFKIEHLLEEKDHQLPKEIEEFRKIESRADGDFTTPFSLLTNSEIEKGFATTSKGKKIKITNANLSELSKSDDKSVRVSSSKSVQAAYLKHKQSLSNLLFQHKKSEATWSVIAKHNSTVESLIFNDRAPKELLINLFQQVQKHVPIVRKWRSAWKSFYFAKFKEKPTKYDFSRELIKPETTKVGIEDGIKIMLEALKPMGEEYVSIVKKGLQDNWVDFCVVKNKRSGAYSIGGTYGIDKKLILMNWDDTDRSIETLVHEFGHSMHSYYSDLNNSVDNSEYEIFVAEIASIFNEIVLLEYQLKHAKNDKVKFVALESAISGFIGTVFRQTEWANYEFDFYEALDKGTPLNTFEAISKLYYENMKKYSVKKNPKYKPEELTTAVRVPHFYYGFYVYKYAIGQLVANIFFAKYKKEGKSAIDFYIKNFLLVGGRKNPLDILKDAKVDLLDPQVFEEGFKTFKNNVEEWIRLGNKLFKIKRKNNEKTNKK